MSLVYKLKSEFPSWVPGNVIWFYIVIAFVGVFGGTALFFTARASGTTVTVCASGCDYTDINSALGAISSGDTVQVQSTYDPTGGADDIINLSTGETV